MWLNYAFGLSAIVLSVLALYIYVFSKKEAYRFFYPALVLFVLFSLVPISYSIYVSFTNLKTGHLLGREQVVKLFKEEKLLDEGSELLQFKVLRTKKNEYLMVVDNLGGTFKKGQHEIVLGSLAGLPPHEGELQKGEVLDLFADSDLRVLHPALGEFQLFRSHLLGKLRARYSESGDGLYDNFLQKKLTEDKSEGQFKINGESVGPGYYTTTGLENYRSLLFDPVTKFVFVRAFGWTVCWALLSVMLTFFLGSFLAVMLNEIEGKAKLIYRLVFIVPYSIPFFISVLMFKGMLNKDFGEINSLLKLMSISPVPWLEHKVWARVSVLMVNLWLGFPYMFLVITGILQSIPRSIYEASSLEGASKIQNFRYLTFPLVIRAMVPLLIGSFAFNFNNFVGIYLLTGGGPVIADVSTPLGETDILISYTYRLAFEGAQGQNFAQAAAVSMLIFIIIVGLTVLNFKVSKKMNS